MIYNDTEKGRTGDRDASPMLVMLSGPENNTNKTMLLKVIVTIDPRYAFCCKCKEDVATCA